MRSQYRTNHIGVDEEVVTRLRCVKMKKKIGCKEKISVRIRIISIDVGKKKVDVAYMYSCGSKIE